MPEYNENHHIVVYNESNPPKDIDSSSFVDHLVILAPTTRELMRMHAAISDWTVRMLELYVVNPGPEANYKGPMNPNTGHHYTIRYVPDIIEGLRHLQVVVRMKDPSTRQNTSLNYVDGGKGIIGAIASSYHHQQTSHPPLPSVAATGQHRHRGQYPPQTGTTQASGLNRRRANRKSPSQGWEKTRKRDE